MLDQALPDAGFLLVLLLGLLLGLQHALDADHLAAVSSLLTRTRSVRRSSRLGAFWGMGHTLTLLFAGSAILITKTTVTGRIAFSFEFAVGIVLLFLGASVTVRTWLERVHIHFHEHDDKRHAHFHSHHFEASHSHEHHSLLVGMVHGLAGSGTLTLLALSSAKSLFEGLAYIAVFGLGATIGMTCISTVIGIPFMMTANHFSKLGWLFRTVAGCVTIALGLQVTLEALTVLSET